MALLAALLIASPWSAQLIRDAYDRPALTVTQGGRTWIVSEASEVRGPNATEEDHASVGVGDTLYRLEEGKVTNAYTGASCNIPTERPRMDASPQFRSEVAVPLKDRFLWIAAWRDYDVSLDPVDATKLYEVGVAGGKPVLLRHGDLPMQYQPGRAALVKGDTLLYLSQPQTLDGDGTPSMVAFDLKTWLLRSQTEDGHAFFGPSGAAYWVRKSALLRWSTGADGWIAIAPASATDTALAYNTDYEDLIVTRHGLRLAGSGASYAFASTTTLPTIYIRPKVGIGVVYGSVAKANVWLDARTLRPLCPIRPLS